MSAESDPQREFAVDVVRRLVDAGYEALWAGGCVRDFLLGRVPGDYDVATNAKPADVREVFGRRRTIPVGESFGVIIVQAPRSDWNVEVATFRTDLDYVDGRRPTGVVFTTAEEDAQRRDFTINGMFYDPLAERVIDHVGGEEDLRRGVVRAIGDPRLRFAEDKLRMLRAVRFAAKFDFELDPATAAVVAEMAGEIEVVSVERIAAELRKMLLDRHRDRAVASLHALGLLMRVLPELTPSFSEPGTWRTVLERLRRLERPSFELALAALLLDVADAGAVARRLRLSNDGCARIGWLTAGCPRVQASPSLPLHELKPLLAHDGATELLALARADALAREADTRGVEFAVRYRSETPAERLDPPPFVTGRDLIDRGTEPGPRFKDVLDTIRRRQLDEQIVDRPAALAELDRLLVDDA